MSENERFFYLILHCDITLVALLLKLEPLILIRYFYCFEIIW